VARHRQRRLAFEGAVNFRDMGGYPADPGRRTRWHTLYRSDSLADLTEADQAMLTSLGLRTLVDFRLPEERKSKPNRLPANHGIAAFEFGFVPAGTLDMLKRVREGTIDTGELERHVIAQYRRFPVDHGEEYRQVFAIASRPESFPLLIHCTSGKDRTGFGIATLLLAVGVPRDVVLEDYELTNQYRRAVPQLFGPGTPETLIRLLLSAQGKYLEAALDEIDRTYGSMDGFLAKALGVDDKARSRLIENLTEPDNAP